MLVSIRNNNWTCSVLFIIKVLILISDIWWLKCSCMNDPTHWNGELGKEHIVYTQCEVLFAKNYLSRGTIFSSLSLLAYISAGWSYFFTLQKINKQRDWQQRWMDYLADGQKKFLTFYRRAPSEYWFLSVIILSIDWYYLLCIAKIKYAIIFMYIAIIPILVQCR